MKFNVVNTFYENGVSYAEEELASVQGIIKNGSWTKEDDLIENCRTADGVICASPIQEWTPRVIRSLEKCRTIATLSIGYDRIPVAVASEMGIAVTNIPDYCIDEVSNQAITMLLTLNRQLFGIDKEVRETQVFIHPGNREMLEKYPVRRLHGQTLGIIGFGRIGTALALKAKGFGMKIVAYDPYVFGAVMRSHGVEPIDFETLVSESDFISVNCILNDETRGIIGRDEFTKMKKTCYLINTARAGMVDQDALIDALQNKRIAGAGIDVTVDEPVSPDNPMLKLSNCILTGHSAWYSQSSCSPDEFYRKPLRQIIMALRGMWPTYAVNPESKQRFLQKWKTV